MDDNGSTRLREFRIRQFADDGQRTGENRAFTDRTITALQKMSIRDGVKAVTMHNYLLRMGRVAFNMERELFMVLPTAGNPQVAIWLMPLLTEQRETGHG
jgi:hypothetical protein